MSNTLISLNCEHNLKVYCQEHKKKIIFLSFRKQNQKLIVDIECKRCLVHKQEFTECKIIELSQLFENNKQDIICGYPPFKDQSFLKDYYEKVKSDKKNQQEYMQQLKEKFQRIKQEIIQKLETIEIDMINKCEKQIEQSQNLQNQIYKLQQRDELINLISKDLNVDSKLKEFIEKQYQNLDSLENTLRNKINEYEKLSEQSLNLNDIHQNISCLEILNKNLQLVQKKNTIRIIQDIQNQYTKCDDDQEREVQEENDNDSHRNKSILQSHSRNNHNDNSLTEHKSSENDQREQINGGLDKQQKKRNTDPEENLNIRKGEIQQIIMDEEIKDQQNQSENQENQQKDDESIENSQDNQLEDQQGKIDKVFDQKKDQLQLKNQIQENSSENQERQFDDNQNIKIDEPGLKNQNSQDISSDVEFRNQVFDQESEEDQLDNQIERAENESEKQEIQLEDNSNIKIDESGLKDKNSQDNQQGVEQSKINQVSDQEREQLPKIENQIEEVKNQLEDNQNFKIDQSDLKDKNSQDNQLEVQQNKINEVSDQERESPKIQNQMEEEDNQSKNQESKQKDNQSIEIDQSGLRDKISQDNQRQNEQLQINYVFEQKSEQQLNIENQQQEEGKNESQNQIQIENSQSNLLKNEQDEHEVLEQKRKQLYIENQIQCNQDDLFGGSQNIQSYLDDDMNDQQQDNGIILNSQEDEEIQKDNDREQQSNYDDLGQDIFEDNQQLNFQNFEQGILIKKEHLKDKIENFIYNCNQHLKNILDGCQYQWNTLVIIFRQTKFAVYDRLFIGRNYCRNLY